MCCEHGKSEHHTHEETQRGIGAYLLMGASAALLVTALLLPEGTAQMLLYLASYLLVGAPVLKEAFTNILHGEIFDENFLMTVASIGAFCIGEYPEAASVMLLYSIGEALQDKAVDSSRRSIEVLLNVRPDTAILLDGTAIPAADVAVGTEILVRPGERIPLDGVVLCGASELDTSALTGESLPRQCAAGDRVLAGCVNRDGVLTVRVERPYGESSVSRIMDMVENAQEHKAPQERFITRFSRIYTPVVCGLAVLLAVVPPLFGWGSWSVFIHKALAFLVISCPCALVISVPLTFFSGIGCAGHHGILLKGGNYLETLSQATVAAFDKTGTLTKGAFQIVSVEPANGYTAHELLETAAYAESGSTHPLARCIVEAYAGEISAERLTSIREHSGCGVEAVLDGHRIRAGKREMLNDCLPPEDGKGETGVYLAQENVYMGRILLADTIKDDAFTAIVQLRKLGFSELVMLSGDRRELADSIAAEIGLDSASGELLPEDKVARLKTLKQQGVCLYAGDGINDAPVLAVADVGIAMGALGSDAAMEAADVVIMTDEPGKIPLAIRIARRTMRIAKENIIFSLLIKAAILIVSVLTDIGLWLAVFADVGVCLLAIANSLRALRIRL